MKAAIISIGDELLIGQVVNTNASWLGERLVEAGIEVVNVSTIGDDRDVIANEIRRLAALADLVIVSGGLGPTDDDVTRDAVCDLLECGMRIDDDQLARIEQRFAHRGMNERSRQQARVPSGARTLPNEYGSAPGLDFVVGATRVIVVPGVPSELRGIMNDHVFASLDVAADAIAKTTLLVYGPTESALAHLLADASPLVGDGVSLAFLPSLGGTRLRVMRTRNDVEVVGRYRQLVEHIRERAAEWIVSDDGSSLAQATGAALRARGLTVCTAESCTGGLIATMLTDASGSSEYFHGGVVSYANDVKVDLLDVASSMIDEHGAVSEPVARAMAEGARRKLGADIAVAVTGIAGPSGGSDEKPVGTVWIAVAQNGSTVARLYRLGSERDAVRQRAANAALDLVRRAALTGVAISEPADHQPDR